MQIRKIIERRIRRTSNGVDSVGDLTAAIAVNVDEDSSTNRVSTRSSVSAQSVSRQQGRNADDAAKRGQQRT
jgi:hypothetical protein